jgi:UDP-4-amino-4-deoxy-L-arabinose formyltransferase/UDP-glucuronic acid dehydrogenase (UDP-4-keto-hexauronic acid decarboxylating)
LTVEKFDAQQISQISALEPALMYSFYYRNLLPDEVLRLATIGAFNLHGSLLPKYRGRAPVNWVLVNGEHETGVTLHQMVARADAGELVAQRAIPIHDTDTALTLYRKLVPLGAEVIGTYHPQLVAGRAPRRPQDLSQGSYYGRRTPEDGRVDWSWPARQIFNLVRAVTHPYPGAVCSYRGQKLFIWQASIAHESGSLGEAGQILRILGDDVEVAAGDGSVLVSRAQLESGDEAAAAVVFDSGVAPDAKLK